MMVEVGHVGVQIDDALEGVTVLVEAVQVLVLRVANEYEDVEGIHS